MTTFVLNGLTFEAELVVFDKDGVLVDLFFPWQDKVLMAIDRLVERVHGANELRRDLYRALGFDMEGGHMRADSPLVAASPGQLHTIAASVLYQFGLPWHEAENIVQGRFLDPLTAPITAEDVRPLVDVGRLFRQLIRAGSRIAVVTSDDRAATEATLAFLDVGKQVSLVICGDDAGPKKPAPEAIWKVCQQLGVEPGRTLMVGDTMTDMMMATGAGVGCRVGVLSGAGDRSSLASLSDVILASIDEIEVSGMGLQE